MKKSILSAVLALSACTLSMNAQTATSQAMGGANPRPQAMGGANPRPQTTTASADPSTLSVILALFGIYL